MRCKIQSHSHKPPTKHLLLTTNIAGLLSDMGKQKKKVKVGPLSTITTIQIVITPKQKNPSQQKLTETH